MAAQQKKPMAESALPAREAPAALAGEERPADPKDADDVLTNRMPGSEEADAAVLATSRRYTRRAFVAAGVATAAAGGFAAYLNLGPEKETQPGALRDAFVFSQAVSRGIFRERALAPTYPLSRAENLRVNGMFGVKKALVPESWRLQMVGVRNAARRPGYVDDVTAWEYRYTEAKTTEDPGHDTKVDPSKQAGGAGPASNAGDAGKIKDHSNGEGSNADKTDKSDTATKMAPAQMQVQAKSDESKQGVGGAGSTKGGAAKQEDAKADAPEQDDDELGRKPRGLEEAGESDSTLPAGTPGLLLQISELARFPRHELVTQFKCIEGWSQVVQWAGIRMSDFLDAYPPEPVNGREPRYVYMETPDGNYYVGYDLDVLRHPQTLLVTEMMGKPLTQFHGAPLRLHTPLKYGYKQIKRIGLIAYTNDKPDDYWTKLGYDWYAGL